MKVGIVLLVLALVLAILGAGLSYLGYEGPYTMTVTSSQPVTATSTITIASTSEESTTTTTSGTNWILQDETINIPAGTTQKYCGYWESRQVSLDAGQVHVSYHTESKYHQVDFWMMNQEDYTRWSNLAYCTQILSYQGSGIFVAKLGASEYEFTRQIGSAGTYYFAFMNENRYPINVTLNVDEGLQTGEVTFTKATTYYSTQETPYVTEESTLSTVSVPAGFGLLFYAGIGLIAVAVIVVAISRLKSAAPKKERFPSATIAAPVGKQPTREDVVPPPVAPAQAAPPKAARPPMRVRDEERAPTPRPPPGMKYCVFCGHVIPLDARFCTNINCGKPQK